MYEGMIVRKCACGKVRAYAGAPTAKVYGPDGKTVVGTENMYERKKPYKVMKETYRCRKCRKHARRPKKA